MEQTKLVWGQYWSDGTGFIMSRL